MIDESTHILDQNAIDILMADHKKVKKLFKDYQTLIEDERSNHEKEKLATTICEELENHATIEEEIFYPRVRAVLHDKNLMDEAQVEHDSFQELINQIRSMNPEDDLYDAKVTVLGEYVEHHVKEEEDEMFPKVRISELDLEEIGEEMAERREELETSVASTILDKIKNTVGVE